MKCWIAAERSHQDSEFQQSNPMIWAMGREREGGYRVVREVKKKGKAFS